VAAFLVAARVQRQQHLLGDLAGLLEDAIDQLRRKIGAAGEVSDFRVAVQLVQHEAHVAERRLVGLHAVSLHSWRSGRVRHSVVLATDLGAADVRGNPGQHDMTRFTLPWITTPPSGGSR